MRAIAGHLAERVETSARCWLGESERARRIYPAALLVITLVVWFPALFTGLETGNPDDFYHITQAALHHSPGDIFDWFRHGYWAYTHYEYRPLTRLSLLVDYLIWGPRPLGFHLGNLVLHFACCWLLAALMVRAGAPVWAARLSGLVAVVFPAGQMAVSWITGRQDLLCGALLLGGSYLFLSWVEGMPWPHLVGAMVCVLLSALAKEPGAVTPLFLLVAAPLTGLPGQGGRRPHWARILGLMMVCVPLVPYLWLRAYAWSLTQYTALNAPQLRPLKVGLRYLFGDLLLPRPHELATLWRGLGLYSVFSPRFPQLLLEQVAFWVALVVLVRRQRSLLAMGAAWKLVFFLPVYNLYWNPAFTHYRYLPHLGTAWLVGLAAWELAGYTAGKMRAWGRPLVRGGLITVALVLLLGYYARQLHQHWPPWWLIRQGGPTPPAAFCRDLQGPDAPFRLDDRAIGPPRR